MNDPLAAAIRCSWSAATSVAPKWTPERPSTGQCAVTALVVQDYLCGDLVRSVVCGQSHYWNRLPDGTEVDLTADQFDDFRLDGPVEVRDRAYVLSYPDTSSRYDALRAAVADALRGAS